MSIVRGRDDTNLAAGRLPALSTTSDWLVDACVLIVDDLDANVAVLQRILNAAGAANVQGVTDARLAVGRCREIRPDLILLDVHMPHVDGHEVLRGLREVLPPDEFLPIVMLTADTATAVREQALEAGADDFLTKPFDRVEVVQRVRNLLALRAMHHEVQCHNADRQTELEEHARERQRAVLEAEQRLARVMTALTEGVLRMKFQPIVELHSGRVVGVEALARFDCEPCRPAHAWFADAAEAGLGVRLELAAIEAALARIDDLPPDMLLSVSASPNTALSGELRDRLQHVPGPRIVLELTEHTRITDYDPLIAALDGLRGQGVRIAADDAGAGYAGLQQILRLRPDIIKLDVAITHDINRNPIRRALAASLLMFAQETGAVVLAEGIETAGELAMLRALGVSWGQGVHLARPGSLPVPQLVPVEPVAADRRWE